MNLRKTLESRLQWAFARCGVPEDLPAVVSPSARSEFGDYQASGAMAAAKRLKTNPRQLAQKIREAALQDAETAKLAGKIEVAGPGFINIFLKGEFLQGQLAVMSPGAGAESDRLGVEKPANPQAVVVDYSSPNLAKEMHVGHLRSTIIGDAIARVLEFTGHKVIRQNHVGDWGTQFGMLLAYWHFLDQTYGAKAYTEELPELRDLEEFYTKARARLDSDAEFATVARLSVRVLQGTSLTPQEAVVRRGEMRLWEQYREISLAHCQFVYGRLGVTLTPQHVRGESDYNDDLPGVVRDLKKAGLLTESKGAQCVFLSEFKGHEDEPLPFIVQKSGEGYLYATTDLAAIRYRVGELKADRILYVVDARQSLHFKMLFAVARKAGFAPENVSLEHIPFGTVMGPDGKPFKTREGGTVKLMDLLEEAVKKARELVERKNAELSEPVGAEDVSAGRAQPLSDDEKKQIAEVVGIGAVKYADLSQNRASDYVFSWEKMLSLDGNTAPYMQYAYARTRSIRRKAEASRVAGVSPARGEGILPSRVAGILPASVSSSSVSSSVFLLSHSAERALAVKLLQFPETAEAVGEECLPNILCGYLYDLAGLFMRFFENCPVLQSEEPLRSSRLALCDLTGAVIKKGLELLGIGTIERM